MVDVRARIGGLSTFLMLLICIWTPLLADVIGFQEYPDAQANPLVLDGQSDGLFTPIERKGNLLTTTTFLNFDTPLDNQTNGAPRQALTETVIQGQGDVFDFVFFLSTAPIKLSVGEFDAAGIYWHIKNDVSGIGFSLDDQSQMWGSEGRLQGFIDLGQATSARLEPQSFAYRFLLKTVMHEIMHRWSSYVSYLDDGMVVRPDLLGHLGSHWNSLLHSQGSVMYGHDWEDLGSGSFRSGPTTRRYSDMDLYLAGFLNQSEVEPILLLRDASLSLGQFPKAGQVIGATPEYIEIGQIIDYEGARVPSVEQSQKHFRAALVIVAQPDELIPAGMLASLERLRRDIQDRFSYMTEGRAVLHIVPEAYSEGATGLPVTLSGSEQSMTDTVDTDAALDWLAENQDDDGFWADREGSRWRDTSTAIEVLRLLRPDAAELTKGRQALAGAEAPTSEALAWRAFSFPGDLRDQSEIDLLLSSQHSGGGWGITNEHVSNMEDTANILRSFWDVLPAEASAAALAYIAGGANSDGGWGYSPGSASKFSATLAVLEALALPLSEHADALQDGREWLITKHHASGEFIHRGQSMSAGDASRALSLLFGSDVPGDVFISTANWLARSQGDSGDWGGSAFSTARALITIGQLDLPNLQIVGQPFSIPDSPTQGSLVRLTARVGNGGLQAASESQVRWYDGDPRAGGQSLSAPITVPALSPSSSVLVRSLVDTLSLAPDTTLWVVADETETIEEWTREDNYASLQLDLSTPSPRPDLNLHPDAVVLSPATVGSIPSEVRVTGSIRNLGLSDVSSAQLALLDVESIPPKLLAETDIVVSAQGQSAFVVTFDYTGEQSGHLALIADPAERIDDADRRNNRLDLELAIATGVDIAVESIELEPVGATYAGRPIGGTGLADMTCFSFHPVKTITTGEGGAVLTDDRTLAERLRRLRHHGITKTPETLTRKNKGPWYYELHEPALNGRLTDIQCALGLSQIAKLDRFIARRRQLAQRYREELAHIPGVGFQAEPDSRTNAYHLFVLGLDPRYHDREATLAALAREGINCQVHYYPLHLQPYFMQAFGTKQGDCPAAESYAAGCISLPIYPALEDADQQRVIARLRELLT